MSKELDALFAQQSFDCADWVGRGKIPNHYHRLSCTREEALRLAESGFVTIYKYFEESTYFTQALIAGAVFSDKYDKVTVVTPSSYGKSWLMGRIGDIMAYEGEPTYVVASSQDGTKMIMGHVVNALQNVAPEVKAELLNKKDQIERLSTSLSKSRIAFANGGFLEPITTGDSYSEDISKNKVIGKPGNYIVDEASLVSEESFAELGRAEFARIDGRNYKRIMISNPHRVGFFYDELTKERVGKREIVIWADALTAVEEERLTKEKVYEGTFAKHKSTLRRYLLCILDDDGEGMFTAPALYKAPYKGDYVQYFMGLDSAYKGKDSIELTVTAVGGGKIHVEEIYEIRKPKKKDWVDGKTSEDIIRQISRYAKMYGVALVCVDIGWGVWLVEGLLRHGINARGVNSSEAPSKERIRKKHYASTNALNKRAEMHLDFQDLVENEVVEVSEQVNRQIKDVLPYVTSERRANGKIVIRPKEEIKGIIGHSPDAFDSVLLSIQAVIQFMGDSSFAIT